MTDDHDNRAERWDDKAQRWLAVTACLMAGLWGLSMIVGIILHLIKLSGG